MKRNSSAWMPVVYLFAPFTFGWAFGELLPDAFVEEVLEAVAMMDGLSEGQPYRSASALSAIAYPLMSPLLMAWVWNVDSRSVVGTRISLVGIATGMLLFAALLVVMVAFGSVDSDGQGPQRSESLFLIMRDSFIWSSALYGLVVGVAAVFVGISFLFIRAATNRH